MSSAAANPKQSAQVQLPTAPWNPWLGAVYVVIVFLAAQFLAGLVLSIYPVIHHWTAIEADNWLNNSVVAQFLFILLAEALTIGAIYLFLRHYKASFSWLGLKRPRWRDVGYGLLVAPAYYVAFFVMTGLASHFIHGFNASQQQQIGFTSVHGGPQLALTFASLVILPPLTEEILVRGFLYSSLKKGLPIMYAALVTSLLFGSAHLAEGGAAGPLWIGALDTFILSLFLIYLREKTASLWGSITLHAIKNGVAFVALFVLHLS